MGIGTGSGHGAGAGRGTEMYPLAHPPLQLSLRHVWHASASLNVTAATMAKIAKTQTNLFCILMIEVFHKLYIF